MKRLWGEGGYTIVEVMIVIAVSGALLASVMTVIGGKQRSTEFQYGVREFQSLIQDIMNDVETGYFPNNGSPGSSSNAIFLGKAIHFHEVTGTGRVSALKEMSISGTISSSNKDATQLSDAVPIGVVPSSTSRRPLSGAVELTNIRYGTGGTVSKGFAIISGINKSNTGSTSSGGKGRFAFINIASVADSDAVLSSAIGSLAAGNPFAPASTGVVFCLREAAGSNRVAAVSYGIVPGPISNGQTGVSETYFDQEARDLGCTA